MFYIIKELSETSLLAEQNGNRYILKLYLPEEKPVYDRLTALRNRNVASFFGYAEISGKPYAVMEYINGISIGEMVRKYGPMPDDMIKRLIKGICNGISAVHEIGIIHRDITPDNIIVDEYGNPKIIDFGISRIYDSSKSKDTQVLGTVGFAAPEQFGFRQTTDKADIYALGVLINYMAEGELPIEKLTAGKYRPIVLKCTQMDDRKRYRSVEELSAAIDNKFFVRRLISSIPGFSGGTAKAICASLYYFYILSSGIVSFALRGKFVVFIAFLACFLFIPFVITDSAGSIKAFCESHGLSHTVVRFIKALLCMLLLLAFMTIIIFFLK